MPQVSFVHELAPNTYVALGDLAGERWGTRFDAARDLTWFDLVVTASTEVLGVVVHNETTGSLVGYGEIEPAPHGVSAKYLARTNGADAERDLRTLLDYLLGAIEPAPRDSVVMWTREPQILDDTELGAIGLTADRELYQMERSIDEHDRDVPGAVSTRPFVIGKDEEGFLELNNAAFVGHPEQGDWKLDTLLARESEPWFDPAGLLLVERDGRPVASCWTKIASTESSLGELYVIAVHPEAQRQGLGRSVALAGLSYLAQRGCRTVILYVDAANVGAVHLYQSLGFAVRYCDRSYAQRSQ